MAQDSISGKRWLAGSAGSRHALWIAAIAIIYFVATRFSLSFVSQSEGISPIWPPQGIFLSAVLLTRRSLRPWLVSVLCVADLAAERLAGTPWLVATLYALVLSGDAVLSVWLLHRFVGEPITFNRLREVVGFLVIAVIFSNTLSSLVATWLSHSLHATTFWKFWRWWLASAGVGSLLVTPFIMSWAALAKTGLGPWKPKRVLEGAALFTSLTALNYIVFGYMSDHSIFSLLHAYITFPFLLWAALRFGVRGVASALLILAAIALGFASTAHDSALSPNPAHWNAVILAQLYLAILAIPSLLVAAVANERKQAEEAQQVARHLLRDVLDTVPVRVFWKDRQSHFLGCNLPFAKDAGLSAPEHLIGKTDLEMPWREQAGLYRADDTQVMNTGIPKLGYEEPQTTPTGEQIWLRTSKIPLKDAAGNSIGVLGTYEDITESKRAEIALRDREQVLSESQRIAHIGSWRWDLGGAIQWTDETYRIYGVSPETFTPTVDSFVNILHPEDQEAMQRWIEACRTGASPGDLEIRTILPDGSVRVLNGRGELKYDSENRPAYMAGTVQDITERKRAERALQQSEALLKKSQAIAHLGSWEFDLITDQLTWSDEVFRIFGLSPREHAADYPTFLECVHPEDRAAIECAYFGSLREGHNTYELEHRIIRRDTGEIRVVHEKCEHIKDASGRVVRSVGMVQDITETKRAEAALRAAKEDLAAANEALERKVQERTTSLKQTVQSLEGVLYHVAHDLRAPLRAMHSFAKLLLLNYGPNFDAQGQDYARRIIAASSKMDELTRDLLLYGRLGHQTVAWGSVNLDFLLDQILNQFQCDLTTQKAEVQIDKPLPAVWADGKIVEQVLTNLLSNALKFVAPNTAPRIHIWGEVMGNSVLLSIRDNGIGIAPEYHQRIFGIFERLHDPEVYPGTGIGLAIVKKGMDLLEGQVQVESQFGKGTRFILKLKSSSPVCERHNP